MIFSYLKERILFLLLLAASLAVILIMPLLYEVYRSASLYAAVLVLFCALLLLIPDYLRWRKYMTDLSHLSGFASADLEKLPREFHGSDRVYTKLIEKYADEYRSLEEKSAEAESDLRDTYILWAHQIKTPIAAMRLLLDEKKDPQVNEQLFRIEEYVNQLLYYFRSERINNDFVIRSYDIDEIVTSCIRKYSMIFIRKHLKLEYEPVKVQVDTDEKWLGFVIEQILSNATKYTKEGSVKIWGTTEKLVIQDTGIGIAAEDLKQIFEKGYTGLNGRQEKRSTGLGLYLCREILTKLGHDIRIESEKNRGTTVTIFFKPQ
ncbi:MAG: sensor histidine kinase [Solobacterium sp.]|nr:sensor histidine kinase [Solobacterium sp.]